MSGEFDSRKDSQLGEFDSKEVSQSTILKRRPRIFVGLSFRELRDSKLSGLHPFDDGHN